MIEAKTLVILRGLPGVGKSTFIKEMDIEHYTISIDSLRLLYSAPIKTKEGKWAISGKNETKIKKLVIELLENRMKKGQFTILDATHAKQEHIERYKELIKKYDYETVVIDFDISSETALERNANREHWKQVPKIAIYTMKKQLEDPIPEWVDWILSPEEAKRFLINAASEPEINN